MHVAHNRICIALHLGIGHGKQRISTVNKCRHGTEGHQGIHIRGFVPQALKAADEEFLVDDHNDGG